MFPLESLSELWYQGLVPWSRDLGLIGHVTYYAVPGIASTLALDQYYNYCEDLVMLFKPRF